MELREFSVRRDDLFFSYEGALMDNVSIRLNKDEEWWPTEGRILDEPEGFPFRDNLKPELRFIFDPEDVTQQLGQAPEDLAMHVTIEDIALGVRTSVATHRLDEIVGREKIMKIDLSSFGDLYFARGFEITCFIHRVEDAEERIKAWSKSHILVSKSFIAKSSEDGAYFDISWINFDDDGEKRNVWYYIDWEDQDISESPGNNLFCVYANEDLRSQFKRLETNSHFGHFVIRQMVSDILFDIILTALDGADLNIEPQSESLHEQMGNLLKSKGIDFNDFAQEYRQAKGLEKRALEAKIKKTVQQIFGVGEALRNLRFGGYRL